MHVQEKILSWSQLQLQRSRSPTTAPAVAVAPSTVRTVSGPRHAPMFMEVDEAVGLVTELRCRTSEETAEPVYRQVTDLTDGAQAARALLPGPLAQATGTERIRWVIKAVRVAMFRAPDANGLVPNPPTRRGVIKCLLESEQPLTVKAEDGAGLAQSTHFPEPRKVIIDDNTPLVENGAPGIVNAGEVAQGPIPTKGRLP